MAASLGAIVEGRRQRLFESLPLKHRARMGQFGTPEAVAELMASMFHPRQRTKLRVLDAGAGVGSLTAALVHELCRRRACTALHVTAYEVEPSLLDGLQLTLEDCNDLCAGIGIAFSCEIISDDFIQAAVGIKTDPRAGQGPAPFDCAILNPPYKKIRSDSTHRALLRRAGIEVSNLYAAFVSLALRLLGDRGELVAITPRSFCNGPYFAAFRRDFLELMSLQRLHVFDSRTKAFGGDGVLQENVITHAIKGADQPARITVSSSSGEPGAPVVRRLVGRSKVVPHSQGVPFIHLITTKEREETADQMARFAEATLEGIGVQVSTGRVVDFRCRGLLRKIPGPDDVPLIYPVHFREGAIRWPLRETKKPNAMAKEAGEKKLLVPPGRYVLIKRFSSKEQRRRVDAAIYDSAEVAPRSPVGFENHLNYLHVGGGGLDAMLAVGLAVYFNSTLLDEYFRLFSGHTQVNATDLRSLPLPAREVLLSIGREAGTAQLAQQAVDDLINRRLN